MDGMNQVVMGLNFIIINMKFVFETALYDLIWVIYTPKVAFNVNYMNVIWKELLCVKFAMYQYIVCSAV